jgi:hypothetical protein
MQHTTQSCFCKHIRHWPRRGIVITPCIFKEQVYITRIKSFLDPTEETWSSSIVPEFALGALGQSWLPKVSGRIPMESRKAPKGDLRKSFGQHISRILLAICMLKIQHTTVIVVTHEIMMNLDVLSVLSVCVILLQSRWPLDYPPE